MKYEDIEEQLDKLDLHKIQDIEKTLRERFGADKAEEIASTWNRLADEADRSDEPGRQDRLYEYLHNDYELSMIVTCYTDADIIRNICRWLGGHIEYFGQHILDVGCGTGIVSCILAGMLPKADITAIDRSPECIKIANIIKEKLGITNIRFVNMSAEDISASAAGNQAADSSYILNEHNIGSDSTFDTVFSARTFHENIGIRYTDNLFLPFSKQVEAYAQIYRKYCLKLAELVSPGGTLVCIERNHMDTEYYSVLRNLSDCGMKIIAESLQELRCEESDFADRSVFQTFAFKKQELPKDIAGLEQVENPPERDAVLPEQDEVSLEHGTASLGQVEKTPDCRQSETFALWRARAFADSDQEYMFTRSQADWYAEQNADGIISGYETFAPNGMQVARMALLKIRGDKENFILQQITIDQTGVQILPLTVLNDVQNALLSRRSADQAVGYMAADIAE